jgi:hypothetical protein
MRLPKCTDPRGIVGESRAPPYCANEITHGRENPRQVSIATVASPVSVPHAVRPTT